MGGHNYDIKNETFSIIFKIVTLPYFFHSNDIKCTSNFVIKFQ